MKKIILTITIFVFLIGCNQTQYTDNPQNNIFSNWKITWKCSLFNIECQDTCSIIKIENHCKLSDICIDMKSIIVFDTIYDIKELTKNKLVLLKNSNMISDTITIYYNDSTFFGEYTQKIKNDPIGSIILSITGSKIRK